MRLRHANTIRNSSILNFPHLLPRLLDSLLIQAALILMVGAPLAGVNVDPVDRLMRISPV